MNHGGLFLIYVHHRVRIRFIGDGSGARETNRISDKIRGNIHQAYRKIAARDNYVIAEKVCNAHLGSNTNHTILLAVFLQHNDD